MLTYTGEALTRQCRECDQDRPLDQLVKSPRSKYGRALLCKACHVARTNEARKKRIEEGREPRRTGQKRSPEKRSRAQLLAAQRKSKYGITDEQFGLMLAAQQGLCATCRGVMAPPHVDHDHESGKVRGLLCGPCNRALGLFRDDPEAMERAADYVRAAKMEV